MLSDLNKEELNALENKCNKIIVDNIRKISYQGRDIDLKCDSANKAEYYIEKLYYIYQPEFILKQLFENSNYKGNDISIEFWKYCVNTKRVSNVEIKKNLVRNLILTNEEYVENLSVLNEYFNILKKNNPSLKNDEVILANNIVGLDPKDAKLQALLERNKNCGRLTAIKKFRPNLILSYTSSFDWYKIFEESENVDWMHENHILSPLLEKKYKIKTNFNNGFSEVLYRASYYCGKYNTLDIFFQNIEKEKIKKKFVECFIDHNSYLDIYDYKIIKLLLELRLSKKEFAGFLQSRKRRTEYFNVIPKASAGYEVLVSDDELYEKVEKYLRTIFSYDIENFIKENSEGLHSIYEIDIMNFIYVRVTSPEIHPGSIKLGY